MKIVLLLLVLLTVSECFSSSVEGQTGENVTLTCKYDIKKHGALYVCWIRGDIPSRGCGNPLVSTDGYKVKEESRVSSKYQLTGRLDEGDISLTIMNLTEDDAGRYGCRVEISGWFNDAKHHFDLTVRAQEATSTQSTAAAETSTESTATSQTAGHMTSTENHQTSSSSGVDSVEEDSNVTVVLVCVLCVFVVLLTASGLFFVARRWRRLNKIPQRQISTLAQFSSTSSTLQLHSRGSAVENIYQIDASDYEYCP